MKQYIEVKQCEEKCSCIGCGRNVKDDTLEEKIIYDISFVTEFSTTKNKHSQTFRLCWDCTETLVNKIKRARYDSVK